MWNKPSAKDLSSMPALYGTENIACPDKIVHQHFFMNGSAWFACEYDPENKIFFGFVILNQDYVSAEWGYFSLQELEEINIGFMEIDRNLHFSPKPAKEIENIRKARSYQSNDN